MDADNNNNNEGNGTVLGRISNLTGKVLGALGFGGSTYNLTTTDSSVGGSNPDGSAKDKDVMYRQELNREMKLLYTTKLEVRLKACKNLAFVAWDACDSVQKYLVQESHAIDLLLNIIQDSMENDLLRLEVIKTLNVLLKSGRTVFKFMVQIKNIVKILINVINEDEIEIGKWIISTIFYCTVFEIDTATQMANNKKLDLWFKKMADQDWSQWPANDAVGLLNMIELSQCDGAHSLIQGINFGRRSSTRSSFQKDSLKQAKPVYF